MALTLLSLFVTQPLDDSGAPVPGGQLQFYEAGTVTPKDVFSDANGGTPLSNPVILDAYGRATIFLDNDGAYDIVFMDPNGATIWTLDGVVAAAPVI